MKPLLYALVKRRGLGAAFLLSFVLGCGISVTLRSPEAIAGASENMAALSTQPDIHASAPLVKRDQIGPWSLYCSTEIKLAGDCAITQAVRDVRKNIWTKVAFTISTEGTTTAELFTNSLFGDKHRISLLVDGDQVGTVNATQCTAAQCDFKFKVDTDLRSDLISGDNMGVQQILSPTSGATLVLRLADFRKAAREMRDAVSNKVAMGISTNWVNADSGEPTTKVAARLEPLLGVNETTDSYCTNESKIVKAVFFTTSHKRKTKIDNPKEDMDSLAEFLQRCESSFQVVVAFADDDGIAIDNPSYDERLHSVRNLMVRSGTPAKAITIVDPGGLSYRTTDSVLRSSDTGFLERGN